MKTSNITLKVSLIILLFISLGCSKSDSSLKNQNEYWTCTMHPEIHKDGPGVCPICGMDLIKKVTNNTTSESSISNMEGMIKLTSDQQILANVSTIKIKKEILRKQITAYSYLDFAEQNRRIISARFRGRIEKLFVDKTGDYVKKGQPLFEIYSPELVQAQNDYLIALNNSKNSNNSLIDASKKKLELLGLTPNQIEDLKNTGEIKLILTYYSPFSGTIIEKKVQEGMYVNEGTTIYELAELSILWNIAELNETDLSLIKVGNKVNLKVNAYPGEEFFGQVTFIYPVINPQTRTVKVRSEFSNYNHKLKPQMYGEITFTADQGMGLLIPSEAIVFSGKRNVVWIKTPDGMFEARNIQLGHKFGDKYEVLSGLNEGDEVVASGGFLIDSESQLRTGLPTGHHHGNENSKSINQTKSSSDNMNNMNMP